MNNVHQRSRRHRKTYAGGAPASYLPHSADPPCAIEPCSASSQPVGDEAEEHVQETEELVPDYEPSEVNEVSDNEDVVPESFELDDRAARFMEARVSDDTTETLEEAAMNEDLFQQVMPSFVEPTAEGRFPTNSALQLVRDMKKTEVEHVRYRSISVYKLDPEIQGYLRTLRAAFRKTCTHDNTFDLEAMSSYRGSASVEPAQFLIDARKTITCRYKPT